MTEAFELIKVCVRQEAEGPEIWIELDVMPPLMADVDLCTTLWSVSDVLREEAERTGPRPEPTKPKPHLSLVRKPEANDP